MIAWKRSTKSECYIGSHGGRQVARIVRLSASAWRWSYRAPSQAVATIGEAQLLKHAKQAVEGLHQAKCPQQETNAGHENGESAVEAKHGNERVEGSPPAAPRGMVSGAVPERPESAHETPLGAALFEALFGNEVSGA